MTSEISGLSHQEEKLLEQSALGTALEGGRGSVTFLMFIRHPSGRSRSEAEGRLVLWHTEETTKS